MKLTKKNGIAKRLTAILLVAMMAFSNTVSALAIDGSSLTGEAPSSSYSGDELISDESPGTVSSSSGSNGDESDFIVEDDLNSFETEDDFDDGGGDTNSDDLTEENDFSEKPNKAPTNDNNNSNSDGNVADITQFQVDAEKQNQEFMEMLCSLNWTDESGNPITLTPPGLSLFADINDIGSVTSRPIPVNDYVLYPNSNLAYGEKIFVMTMNGEDSFCVQPWLLASGNYTASKEATQLAQGKEKQLGQVVANYLASAKTDAHFAAAQVLMWEILFPGTDFYSYMISGTKVSPAGTPGVPENIVNGQKNITDAPARIAAYNEIKNGSAEGVEIVFWHGGSESQQKMISIFTGEVDPGPVEPDTDSDGDSDGDTPVGTIYIIKKDDEGRSLDGARFKVEVVFSNGTRRVLSESFEVTDGTGHITFTWPKGNTDPATVTVTEIQAPPGYILDSTPKKATVSPTYSEIKGDDEVITVPGQPGEVTFINKEAQCTLIIYKYQKGNSGIPLAGAEFEISYVDPSVDSGRWNVTTGPDGKATVTLPKAGAILIRETKAPENYKIVQTDTTVTISRGETKQVDIPNDKYGSLRIIKRDKDDGRLLPGATFKVTKIGNVDGETGGTTRQVTTGADGTVLVEGLEPGSYRVEEINPPQYYSLSDEPIQTVEILDGSHETISIEFFNEAYTGMRIIKVDAQTGMGLPGAVFSVYRGDGIKDGAPTGELVGNYTTNTNGSILIQNLERGKYTIFEEQPPDGYVLDEERWRIVEVTDDNIDDTIQVIFRNQPKPNLKIIKKDEVTGLPLEGAVFRVAKQNSPTYNEYTTDKNGEIFIEKLDADWYIITEIRAPSGYLLPTDPELDPVQLVPGKTTEVIMTNRKQPTLTIEKVDTVTREPLAFATFKITKQGASEYTNVTTGADGKAVLTGLPAGWYIIEEITAPTGYQLIDETYTIELKPDENAVITIQNTKYPSLTVKKVDAVTRNPLKNAEFTLTKSDGTVVAQGLTDSNGEFYLERIEPGTYKLKETKAPDGYKAVTVEQDIVIQDGKDVEVVVENNAKEPLYIQKIDAKTGKPLDGAVFKVEKTSGEFIGEYTTGITGYATITDLNPGYYVVTEIKAPNGYSLSSSPKTVQLKAGKPATVTFENEPLRGIQIVKVDAETGETIPGVTFKVTKANGSFIGEYKTDESGMITVSGLEPGAYTIVEVATVNGYILDTTPKTVTLEEDNPTVVTVEIKNKPLAGLQIRKIDGATNKPLAGVEFELRTAAGAFIGKYTTDAAGVIFVENLKPGTYVITELSTKENYTLDATPRTVVVKSGKMTLETFKNYPYPVLTIKKVDSETGQPLAGAKFKLMDEAYRELGVITTSELGLVNITKMNAGTYYVQEVEAPNGYVLDATVRQITLEWGKTTVLEVKNAPRGSLRIQKVDAVTGKPLYGATFNLYDKRGNLLGEYTTDNAGMIIFTRQITAGTYKIKEVKAPEGYVLDSTPITINVKSGETTEFTLKNTPETGNIRITKVAADYNDITKDHKGDPLEGAVFEIYNEDGDVVDRITTGADGVAKSKNLPLGKYAIKEITAPKHYITDGKPFYAEIKIAGDLIQFKVENTPTEINTTVQKRGNVEVLPGDLMTWEFYNIENASSVELDEFYWHDLIPTDAVRATSFSTGVWSERVTMTAYYRTNLSSSYRVLKDNLLSTTNHELSLSSSALGLKAHEYVTDVKLVFGTVQPGFHETTRPTLTAYVLPNLMDGYSIVNRTDVGGRNEDEWVYSKDTWTTIVLGMIRGCLPQTGFDLGA